MGKIVEAEFSHRKSIAAFSRSEKLKNAYLQPLLKSSSKQNVSETLMSWKLSLMLEMMKSLNENLSAPEILQSFLPPFQEFLGASHICMITPGKQNENNVFYIRSENIVVRSISDIQSVNWFRFLKVENSNYKCRKGNKWVFSIPVSLLKGRLGILVATGKLGNSPGSGGIDRYIAEALVEHLASVLRNVSLKSLAETDSLTGLKNRGSFEYILRNLYETSENAGVIMFDLDHFKKINDQFGHPVGDRILKELSDLLRNTFSRASELCRIGGEEFAVIMHGKSVSDAESFCSTLKESMKNILDPDGKSISASFGFSEISAHNSYLELYNELDRAMYRSKADGRDTAHRAYC